MAPNGTLAPKAVDQLVEPGIKAISRAPDLGSAELRLAHLSADMVSDRYVQWMNDPEVVRYTESRFSEHSQDRLESFVRAIETDPLSIMWAIFVGTEHIGNIKLGPIDWHHAYADIGLILGSKPHWGKGHGQNAVSLVADWAFETLSLHKLTAGICDGNIGSVRAFEKAGFAIEARQYSHYFLEGEYRDRIVMARFNPRPVEPPAQS